MDELRKNFIIEQYKRLITRIETHERIYYQMLVLYISVLGIVLGLGFSKNISHPELFVPFILLSFLLFVTLICNNHSKELGFESAYLIEIFEKRWKDISFSCYQHNFKSKQKEKSKTRKFIVHPILILFLLTIAITSYFLKDIAINIWECPKNNIFYILYIFIILCLIGGVLWIYLRMPKGGDYKDSIREIQEYENAKRNQNK